MKKEIIKILNCKEKQWVGNGFHVHPIIRPNLYDHTNPFILMDYASPKEFPPTKKKLGVGSHPHKGFETVTFALQGEVEHKDSAGGGGVIKPGDVQWMTAGKGIIHNEFHSENFSTQGGTLEMVQLWVNLPSGHKLTSPKYQNLKELDFNTYKEKGINLKVIAGEYKKDIKGLAETFSKMNIYHLKMLKDNSLELDFEEGTNTVILIMSGSIKINQQPINPQSLVLLSKAGQDIKIDSQEDTELLILNAYPINEPIYAHGPFVMNTKEEIITAIQEYNNGEMN